MVAYTELVIDKLDRREFNSFLVEELGLEIVKMNHILVNHITLLEENVWMYSLSYEGKEFDLDLSILPKFDVDDEDTISEYLFDSDASSLEYDIEYTEGSNQDELIELLNRKSDLIRVSVRTEDYESVTDDTVYNVVGSIFDEYGGFLIEDHTMEMSDKAYFKGVE